MGNPLERRRSLLEEKEYKSLFAYDKFEISQEDRHSLIAYEEQLVQQQQNYVRTSFNIAKILYDARDKLKSYNSGTFMAWYENLGFNKDSVSRLLKKYELYLKFPEKNEYIANMPVRLVAELTKKNSDEELVIEVIDKEIKSTKEYQELKNHYSHCANNKKSNKINELEDLKILLNIRNKGNMDLEELKVLNNILSEIEKLKYRCLNKTL